MACLTPPWFSEEPLIAYIINKASRRQAPRWGEAMLAPSGSAGGGLGAFGPGRGVVLTLLPEADRSRFAYGFAVDLADV
jgi:hypothetical protein